MTTIHDFGPFDESAYRRLRTKILLFVDEPKLWFPIWGDEVHEVILPLMAAYERGDLRMGETTADDVAVRP